MKHEYIFEVKNGNKASAEKALNSAIASLENAPATSPVNIKVVVSYDTPASDPA